LQNEKWKFIPFNAKLRTETLLFSFIVRTTFLSYKRDYFPPDSPCPSHIFRFTSTAPANTTFQLTQITTVTNFTKPCIYGKAMGLMSGHGLCMERPYVDLWFLYPGNHKFRITETKSNDRIVNSLDFDVYINTGK